MKRTDLAVGMEVAYYASSYGFDRYRNDCANDIHWTKVVVIDPGPVPRTGKRTTISGRSFKQINDGVRVATVNRAGERQDLVVRPQMLVRTWAEHEQEKASRIAGRQAYEQRAAQARREREDLMARLMPVIREQVSDFERLQLIDGQTVELTIEELAEIVREAKAAGFEAGRLSARMDYSTEGP